jgi:hypothetical protein
VHEIASTAVFLLPTLRSLSARGVLWGIALTLGTQLLLALLLRTVWAQRALSALDAWLQSAFGLSLRRGRSHSGTPHGSMDEDEDEDEQEYAGGSGRDFIYSSSSSSSRGSFTSTSTISGSSSSNGTWRSSDQVPPHGVLQLATNGRTAAGMTQPDGGSRRSKRGMAWWLWWWRA